MKAKLVSLLTATVLACGLLAGCGSSKAEEAAAPAEEAVEEAAEEAAAPAEEVAEEAEAAAEEGAEEVAAAVGAREPKNGEKYVIGYTYYYSSEFITLMNEGVQEKCDELGMDLIALDAENDSSNQITQVENLIAQDVDCLYIAAVDSDAIVPSLEMAREADIPVVYVNMTVNTDEDYYYSGPDDVLAGYLEMKSAIEKIGGKGNICVLEGPIGQSAQIDRWTGNEKALEELGADINLLTHQTANWSREEAETMTENWLEAFTGDEAINAIVAHNDEMALGAIMAIEAKGLTPGVDIYVTGVDAIEDGCNAVKDGKLLSTVYQDAKLEGGQGIDICYDILTGNPPAEYINLIDMTQYTADNVDELLTTLYAK